MQPMTRRSLLSATATVMAALGLVACDTVGTAVTQVSSDADQVTADINSVANGLAGVLPNVQAITGVAASVVTTIQNGVAQIKSLAATVSTAVKNGIQTAAPYISQVASLVGTISSSLTGMGASVPSWVTDVVTAAKTVLPVALSLAGVALAGAPSTGMTVAQARAILAAAAQGTSA
jgi:phage-related protein